MRVSVIGAGYVGIVTGVCLAEKGHSVVCVEVDAAKVERIRRGEPPIHEEGLPELLRRHTGTAFRATTSLSEAVGETEITLIAVGTPFDGRAIDLSYVTRAATDVGHILALKRERHTVVVKSTVVPGTTDGPVRAALETASGKQAGKDFGLGTNPEFLTEGTAVADFMHPDRIVIGGIDARTLEALAGLYAGFDDVPVIRTNNSTAEMIKYASNSLLATMISFSNEIGNLCSALGGVDVAEVMRGVHLARYFTTTLEDGRRIKAPISSFLWAGCGYGGSCLPKDTKALAAHGAAHGAPMPLLTAVIETNQAQPAKMVALLEKHFPSLRGLRVALLGLAFKEDTDDMRESPAIPIARILVERGTQVIAYDPIASNAARAVLPAGVRYAESLEQALAEADAALLITRWAEFGRLPELLARRADALLLIDGRRMIERQAVSRYDGIGV